MQISSVGYTEINYMGKTRIPMKNGTAVLNVEGKPTGIITRIYGDVMSKGKSIKQINISNKKGISLEKLAAFIDKFGENAIDPDSIVCKIYDALIQTEEE